ncbi:MAG: D-alanyl-D-alanine carboxypeptidase [Clostridia bacterium]|nr:D-alanyl-D-alanine carboxypeptidase [Clostridia bacterium]
MKKNLFRLGAFLLALFMLSTAVFALPAEEPSAETAIEPVVDSLKLPAKSAILIEQTTGQVLYAQNPDERLPIASVTKVMTLLLTMEALSQGIIHLEDAVPISETAASQGGSQVFLEPGEHITLHEVLKAVFVSSANDGAVALAELISGSVDAFVAAMNDRAAALGMHDTVFCNPTGLDDNDTGLSTARDVAIMSRALLAFEEIYPYTTIWTDSIRDGAFGLANTNKLVRFYSGATGLKTGSTSKAKFCVSASAERAGLKLCAVVLAGETSKDRFQAARTMLDWGFANFAYYTPEEASLSPIPVWGGTEGEVSVKAALSGMLLPKTDAMGVTSQVILDPELSAPVEAGQRVGCIRYLKGDAILYEEPVVTECAVPRLTLWQIFCRLLSCSLFG